MDIYKEWNMMHKYLAFAWRDYYPGGAHDDFIGSYDSLGEAQIACLDARPEADGLLCGEILNTETGQWIDAFRGHENGITREDGDNMRTFIDV